MQTNLKNIPAFVPPFWGLNGHIHTIARSFLGDSRKPPCQRIEIATPDDDFLELDVINQENNKPAIALFHGLEGSSARYYIIELMKLLAGQSYSIAAVNFRSCGSRMNRKRRFYHSGATDDYTTVFKWMQNRFPKSKIGAVGFSLGGNALLKYLGERNHSPVEAAAAVSVPYNLKVGSIRIGQGFNQIYEYQFLRTLRQKLDQKRAKFPDLPTFSGSSLYDFDDQITAPIHGFDDAENYYRQCSSAQFIASIQTPTLLIHSQGDPLCPVAEMPLDQVKKNPTIDYILTNNGGHVGFWSLNKNWLNKVILNYLQHNLIE